ncbi:MAG: hypothetical protein V4773_10725 [Verrucomicrobiota bacterium]
MKPSPQNQSHPGRLTWDATAYGVLLALIGVLYLWFGPREPRDGLVWSMLAYTGLVFVLLLKRRRSFASAFCHLPLTAYGVLLAFAMISWSSTGNFPYYSHPDPKDLNLHVGYALASLSTLVGLLSLPVGAGALAVSISQRTHTRSAASDATFYALGLALWASDLLHTGLASWIFD